MSYVLRDANMYEMQWPRDRYLRPENNRPDEIDALKGSMTRHAYLALIVSQFQIELDTYGEGPVAVSLGFETNET
jgi:hypothetical protein